jgi:hypothetical protein
MVKCARRGGGLRFRLGFPELINMFVITLFVFGPLLAARVRESRERYDYSVPVWIAFGLCLVMSFIYGVLNTVTIFQ